MCNIGADLRKNEAMMAGKIRKFRGNAVQFSRPFDSFKLELHCGRMRGFGVVCNPRTNCYPFAQKSHFYSFVLVYHLERHLTSNRATLVHSVYSVLDVKISTTLPLLVLGFHGD